MTRWEPACRRGRRGRPAFGRGGRCAGAGELAAEGGRVEHEGAGGGRGGRRTGPPPAVSSLFLTVSAPALLPTSSSKMPLSRVRRSPVAWHRMRIEAPSRFSSGFSTTALRKANSSRHVLFRSRRPISSRARPALAGRVAVRRRPASMAFSAFTAVSSPSKWAEASHTKPSSALTPTTTQEVWSWKGAMCGSGLSARTTRGPRRRSGCRTQRPPSPLDALEVGGPGGGVAGLAFDHPLPSVPRVEHDCPAVRNVAAHLHAAEIWREAGPSAAGRSPGRRIAPPSLRASNVLDLRRPVESFVVRIITGVPQNERSLPPSWPLGPS